jgi:hypothetical protein
MHGDRVDQGRYGQPRRPSGDKDTDPADGSFPGIGASYLADELIGLNTSQSPVFV